MQHMNQHSQSRRCCRCKLVVVMGLAGTHRLRPSFPGSTATTVALLFNSLVGQADIILGNGAPAGFRLGVVLQLGLLHALGKLIAIEAV